MMKSVDRNISILFEGKEYCGTYTCVRGMITVTSIYGTLSVHGTTIGRAKETLRELVVALVQGARTNS